MRFAAMIGIGILVAGGAQAAPDADKVAACDKSVAVVMAGIQARKDGASMGKTRRAMRKELDRTAGDMLAEWIYALPEDQLTEEVGTVWKAQCLAQ